MEKEKIYKEVVFSIFLSNRKPNLCCKSHQCNGIKTKRTFVQKTIECLAYIGSFKKLGVQRKVTKFAKARNA